MHATAACSWRSRCLFPSPPPPEATAAVTWGFTNNLAACPAGDTVVVESVLLAPTFPAKLRITVTYTNGSGQPKNGVPPESIWVDVKGATGNVAFNDETNGAAGFKRVFADDSTRGSGNTRITVPSCSGCGTGTLKLYVSGILQGTQTATIRTTDSNADGRTTSADVSIACDLNYDNVVNFKDQGAVQDHSDHWRRNALHGTLVRRTNYCETCAAEAINSKGDSEVFWSPSARFVSHSAFIDAGPGNDPSCKIFIVPSSPADGNALTQLTSAPLWYHDYDPSWSPLSTEIIFDRGDSVIIRKPAPWLSGGEVTVTASNNPGCGPLHGDVIPAVSPDGQWVAFSRCNGGAGGWSIWKVPITGGVATQLTATAARTDFYTSWSPDGQTIYFQRIDDTIGPQWTAWKVPAAGGTEQQVFIPASSPATFDIVQPFSSPDGAILTAGYGKRDLLVRNVVTHTLDPTIVSPSASKLIPNYADTSFADKGDFPILSPRLSPDGTRLLLGSKQIWAARRNMNKPPRFTTVGGTAIADTTPVHAVTATVGQSLGVQVNATDPESNPLTYAAFFLKAGMSFNASTRTLTWSVVPPPPGAIYYVKFRVADASGGTDAVILKIVTSSSLGPAAARPANSAEHLPTNPATGGVEWMTPFSESTGAVVRLYDVAGRRVATVHSAPGTRLAWDGRDVSGARVPSGIYLYVLCVGSVETRGRVVMLR